MMDLTESSLARTGTQYSTACALVVIRVLGSRCEETSWKHPIVQTDSSSVSLRLDSSDPQVIQTMYES